MLLVVPWRDTGCEWRRRAHDYVLRYYSAFDLVDSDAGDELFSRADSINVAARASDAEVIVALDADLIIPTAQIMAAVSLALDAPGMVVPFDELRYLGPAATLRVTEEGSSPWLAEPRHRITPTPSVPMVGGCNVLSRSTFDLIGGWPDGFAGWGCEDIAFANATAAIAPMRRVGGPAIHLHHPKDGAYVDPDVIAANSRRLEAM